MEYIHEELHRREPSNRTCLVLFQRQVATFCHGIHAFRAVFRALCGHLAGFCSQVRHTLKRLRRKQARVVCHKQRPCPLSQLQPKPSTTAKTLRNSALTHVSPAVPQKRINTAIPWLLRALLCSRWRGWKTKMFTSFKFRAPFTWQKQAQDQTADMRHGPRCK